MTALVLVLIVLLEKFFASIVIAGCITYSLYLNSHRRELVTKSITLAQHLEGSVGLSLHHFWKAYYQSLDRLERKTYHRSVHYFSDLIE